FGTAPGARRLRAAEVGQSGASGHLRRAEFGLRDGSADAGPGGRPRAEGVRTADRRASGRRADSSDGPGAVLRLQRGGDVAGDPANDPATGPRSVLSSSPAIRLAAHPDLAAQPAPPLAPKAAPAPMPTTTQVVSSPGSELPPTPAPGQPSAVTQVSAPSPAPTS